MDNWVDVLKAQGSFVREWFYPHHHHQHPLIQCDISNSPANCATLTGSKQHTYTPLIKTQSFPAHCWCVQANYTNVSLWSLQQKWHCQRGREACCLNEASWWFRALWVLKCMCASIKAGVLVCHVCDSLFLSQYLPSPAIFHPVPKISMPILRLVYRFLDSLFSLLILWNPF